MNLYSIVVSAQDQVSTNLEGQLVVLNLKSGTYYGLKAVGARIWELIQQPVSVSTVCAQIQDEYEVSPELCQKDVVSLLGTLEQSGLVEVVDEKVF